MELISVNESEKKDRGHYRRDGECEGAIARVLVCKDFFFFSLFYYSLHSSLISRVPSKDLKHLLFRTFMLGFFVSGKKCLD